MFHSHQPGQARFSIPGNGLWSVCVGVIAPRLSLPSKRSCVSTASRDFGTNITPADRSETADCFVELCGRTAFWADNGSPFYTARRPLPLPSPASAARSHTVGLRDSSCGGGRCCCCCCMRVSCNG
jgi:hypothetical protein